MLPVRVTAVFLWHVFRATILVQCCHWSDASAEVFGWHVNHTCAVQAPQQGWGGVQERCVLALVIMSPCIVYACIVYMISRIHKDDTSTTRAD